jgi:ABC-2 type transport system ATP-binding protein
MRRRGESVINKDPIAVQTDGLTKTYLAGKNAGTVPAVRSLSLIVPQNAIFGFVGPNGAGKTTTIKLLLGLIRPTAGSIRILGYDAVRESLAIRRRTGYLPQEPRFYEHMTAREILRFKARFYFAGPRGSIERRVDEMLELAGLADRADRRVRGFSGGERQRLGIAQAQINDPDLLILDEPAAGLDPLGRRDILEVMKRLRARSTIFFSTHILDDVQQVSDAVAILHRGELVAQAPLPELLAGKAQKIYVLALTGDARAAQARLEQQEWVISVHATADGGLTRWEVSVADDDLAGAQLLPLVLEDGGLRVVEFGSKKRRLEDLFVELVGSGG